MKIAIDAMGGDLAPSEIVKGTLDAATATTDIAYILVGDKEKITAEIHRTTNTIPSNIIIEHASQVVGMDEPPVEALRKKRDSSIVKAVKLIRDGKADAFLSAGNTGAVVAAATFVIGLLEGVKRAGIAVPLPTEKGCAALIDVGANTNCRPINLLQYGVMASLYSKYVFNNVANPTVGLLNIGEESEKGTDISRQTYQSFKGSSLNFIGNIEGHDIFSGKCNVVVCDGFVGNTILKICEGLGTFLLREVSHKFSSDEKVLKGVSNVAEKIDYSEYGGAPLLGVNGIVIICHGRSKAKAITNAIKVAHYLAKNKMNEHIIEELRKLSWWGRLQDWFTTK